MTDLNQKARAYLRDHGFNDEQIESGAWRDVMSMPDDFAEVDEPDPIIYPDGPDILHNLSNEDYHAGPGLSKSTLWKFKQARSPAHFRHDQDNPKPIAPVTKNNMDFGTAAHTAVLEPEKFESQIVKGPTDRKGNKWKHLVEANPGKVVLIEQDYEGVLRLRDKVHSDPYLSVILSSKSNLIEHSAYWKDHETGLLCKCRPDLLNQTNSIILDVKTTDAADPWSYAKLMGELGYHAQEAWYSDGWQRAGGCIIQGFIFLVIERGGPHEFKMFELKPEAVEEGRAAIDAAKHTYHECLSNDVWPGYERQVEEIDLKPWHYELTKQDAA